MPKLNTESLKKLGLVKQPFETPVSEAEYFSNTSLDMLANGVIKQLQTQQSVQIIKGEYGIGKTCFCNKLLLNPPEELSLTLHTATKKQKSKHIFQSLTTTGNIDPSNDIQQLARQTANRIFQILRNHQQPALIIDDAHLLSAKTLLTLFKFINAISKQGEGQLKLVLVAERSIDTLLAGIDASLLNPDEIHSTLFRPLNRPDIESYIAFRMNLAGANDSFSLPADQLSIIQTKSGGLPYKIDQLSCDALNGKVSIQSTALSARNILIVIGTVILVCVPVTYWLITKSSKATPDKPIAMNPPDSNALKSSAKTLLANPEVTLDGNAKTGLNVESPPSIDAATQETLDNKFSAQSPDRLLSATHPSPETPVATADTQTQSPTNEPQGHMPKDEQWLLNQPTSHYVVQLAGAWNRENLLEFSQKLGIADSVIMISRPRNKQDWFVMLYGPFANYEAALQAVSFLPEDIQSNNPWIRQISSLNKNP